MENYTIARKRDTPEVLMNFKEGIFSLKGRTLLEDSVDFFNPIFLKLKEYLKNPNSLTTIELQFDYFNTTSFKLIIDMLILAKKASSADCKLVVKWFYEIDDEDILMLGQDTARITGLPFEYKLVA